PGIGEILASDIIYTEGPWVAVGFLSRPLKPTQKYVKSWTRYIGADTVTDSGGGAGIASIDMDPVYEGIFGDLPNEGDMVALRLLFQNTTNGQLVTQSAQVF